MSDARKSPCRLDRTSTGWEARIIDTKDFLDRVWGGLHTGYVDIALATAGDKPESLVVTKHQFFDVGFEHEGILDYIERHADEDVYFTPAVYSRPIRSAEDKGSRAAVLYADADTFHPDDFRLRPTIAVESSAGRYQAFWVLDKPYHQSDISRLSTKFAKAHDLDASSGIATKLLRVPGTTNTKYAVDFPVEVMWATDDTYTLDEIESAYADVITPETADRVDLPIPADWPELFEVQSKIPAHPRIEWLLEWDKRTADDPDKRSEHRYELIRLLIEKADLTPHEIAVAVWDTNLADHFREQQRGIEDLLRFDVAKALAAGDDPSELIVPEESPTVEPGDFITADELAQVFGEPGFMERWYEVCQKALHPKTPRQYLMVNGYTYLAGTVGNRVAVIPPGSQRSVYCNLNIINLGPSSTGKSESLFFVRRYIDAYSTAIGKPIIIGSNATAEGLVKALKGYDGRSAMLITEEVAGKFKQWQNSSTMSHAREVETEIYDNNVPQNLRATEGSGSTEKVTVALTNYMLGVDTEVEQILDKGFLRSGYLPRCLIVKADRQPFDLEENLNLPQGDIHRTQEFDPEPRKWATRLAGLQAKIQRRSPQRQDAYIMQFDEDAWARFMKFRADLLLSAEGHDDADLVRPMAVRFAVSVQKMMALIAYEREALTVSILDVLRVLADAEDLWGYTLDLVRAVADSQFARMQHEVIAFIQARGGVVKLSAYHEKFNSLAIRDRSDVLDSLKSRGLVKEHKKNAVPMLVMAEGMEEAGE